MLPIDPLALDHAEIRAACADLRTLTLTDTAPPRSELSETRWRLMRAILSHLTRENRMVYARLNAHSDSRIAAVSARFAADAVAIYDHWWARSSAWTGDFTEENWTQVSIALRQMTRVIEDRLTREERDLFPHLAGAPAVAVPVTGLPTDRNWASHGWDMRARLGLDATRATSRPS